MSSKPVMTARYGLVRTVQTKQNLSTKENIHVYFVRFTNKPRSQEIPK